MEGRKAFIVVARPGSVFNLTDCGIPVDITAHTPYDLTLTATDLEIANSLQLRDALRVGALIRVHPEAPPPMPAPPKPQFVIPELKPVLDTERLQGTAVIQRVSRPNAPDDFNIEGSVPDNVREAIEAGLDRAKAADIAEQQRVLARLAQDEETEVDVVVRTQKKAIPEMKTGTVDGQAVAEGYEFKAPVSPALAEAVEGMGGQLPPEQVEAAKRDPLGANTPTTGSERTTRRKKK